MNASPDILQAFKAFLEEQQHAKMDPDRTEADENVLNRIYDQIVKPTTVMEARGSLQKANPFSDRQTYVVQERDTWSSIAARFNTMPEELIIANPHVSPRTLSAGGRGRRGEAGDGTVKGAIDAKASGLFQSFLNKVGQYGTIGKAASTAMGGMAKLGAYAPAAAQVGMGIKQLGQGGVSSLMAVPMIASGLYGGYKTYKHGPSLTDTVMSAMPIAGSALGPAAFALTSAAKTAMDSGLAARYDPASKWQTAKNMASNVRLAPMAAALASQYAVPYLASGMSANAEALARTAPIAASGLYEYARGRSSPKELLSLYAALMAGAHGPGMRPSDFGVQTAVSNAWENTSGIPRRAWDYTTGLPRRALGTAYDYTLGPAYNAASGAYNYATGTASDAYKSVYDMMFGQTAPQNGVFTPDGWSAYNMTTDAIPTSVNAAMGGGAPIVNNSTMAGGVPLYNNATTGGGGTREKTIPKHREIVEDSVRKRPASDEGHTHWRRLKGRVLFVSEYAVEVVTPVTAPVSSLPPVYTFTSLYSRPVDARHDRKEDDRQRWFGVRDRNYDPAFLANQHIGKGVVSNEGIDSINYEVRPIVRRLLQEGKWGSALTQVVHTTGDRKIIDWLIANVEYSHQVTVELTDPGRVVSVKISNADACTFPADVGTAFSGYVNVKMDIGFIGEHVCERFLPVTYDNNYNTWVHVYKGYWEFVNWNRVFKANTLYDPSGHLFDKANLTINSQSVYGDGRDAEYFSNINWNSWSNDEHGRWMFLRNALVRRLDDKFPVVIGVNASTLTDAAVTSPVYNGVMTGRELYERVSMVDYDNTTATTFKLLAAAENNSNPTVSNLVTDIKCLILAGDSRYQREYETRRWYGQADDSTSVTYSAGPPVVVGMPAVGGAGYRDSMIAKFDDTLMKMTLSLTD
eukprot:jgi/Mesvir1/19546/Mv18066-RA.1